MQSLSISPALYSIDLDNLVSMNTLKYVFYCSAIDSNQLNSSSNSSIDLARYKNNSQLPMQWNKTCFDSNSKIYIKNITFSARKF